MRILRSIADVRSQFAISSNRSRKRVLVPTMGSLHDGHLQLIRDARVVAGDDGDVVVSVFVNPAQFDRESDFSSYPRDLDVDAAACENEGVDAVFAPDPADIYAADHSIQISETLLTRHLCGATRPGHFEGVCLVVAKLFNIVRCDAAIFGKKDYQQLAVIKRMVRDLNMPVDVLGVETVREPDGLALSSRNLLLTREARGQAPVVRRALTRAAAAVTDDAGSAAAIKQKVRAEIESADLARIDYLEIVDAENLQPVEVVDRPSVLATAVFFGDVRLIDNLELPTHGGGR